MRVLAVVLALGVAAPAVMTLAQTPAPAQAPQGKPAPAAPRPQGQTPGGPQQPSTPPVVQLPPPFQGGFKYAFVRFDIVARESIDGKKATTDIVALQESRQREITEKEKNLQDMQNRLRDQGPLMSDGARLQLQSDIERLTRDAQRAVEDAQKDVERLQTLLQKSFLDKVLPMVDRLAKEKGLDMVFNSQDSGLVWAQPGMDLTTDLIRALDAAATGKPFPGGSSAASPSAPAGASAPTAPASATPPATAPGAGK